MAAAVNTDQEVSGSVSFPELEFALYIIIIYNCNACLGLLFNTVHLTFCLLWCYFSHDIILSFEHFSLRFVNFH